jgi:hypothetical protein
MLTDLEKQLIVLSAHGIYITHEDVHRWINSVPQEAYDYEKELDAHGILVNNKIYGGVKEAVEVINATWLIMYDETLVDTFDGLFDDRFDV